MEVRRGGVTEAVRRGLQMIKDEFSHLSKSQRYYYRHRDEILPKKREYARQHYKENRDEILSRRRNKALIKAHKKTQKLFERLLTERRLADPSQMGYIAGLVDGDGSIILHLKKRRHLIYPSVTISNTDREMLEKCAKILVPFMPAIVKNKGNRGKTKRKTAYVLIIHSFENILSLLSKIRPYLKRKQRQADLMMKWIKYRLTEGKNKPHGKVDMDFYGRMKVLNKRGI